MLLKPSTTALARVSVANAVVARAKARTVRQVPQIGLVTVLPRPGETLAQLSARLRRDPRVRSVQPEGTLSPRYTPNDPALTEAETSSRTVPGTTKQWQIVRQNLPGAWDITRGDGALVGVIDTGIDATHPEFAGKIAAAVDQEVRDDTGPAGVDTSGHGTHVSSLACAAGNNGLGIVGAGLNCKLVFEKSDLTDTSVANAIVDAANRGVLSLNMSFGDDGSRPTVDAFVQAINYAYARGVVLVAAASDDSVQDQGQPASLLQPSGTGANVNAGRGLSVTSSNYFDANSGGGIGSQISMAAYGSYDRFTGTAGPPGLLGAFPTNNTTLETGSLVPLPPQPGCGCRTIFDGDRRYAYLQGTSMSAPQVAAVAALIRHFNPDIPVSGVLTILKQSARRAAGSGWNAQLGWGILDAGAALRLARTLDLRAPASHLSAPGATRQRTVLLKWTGTDTAPRGVTVSGIARFDLYRSIDGHAYRRILRTARHSLRIRVSAGRLYRFYTVASDRRGNVEHRPARADALVHVLAPRRG